MERYSRVDKSGRITIHPKLAENLYDIQLVLAGAAGVLPTTGTTYEMLILAQKGKLSHEEGPLQPFKLSMQEDCTIDKKRRLLVPSYLADYAGIEIGNRVTIVGEAGSTELFICEKERWDKYKKQALKETRSKILSIV